MKEIIFYNRLRDLWKEEFYDPFFVDTDSSSIFLN